MLLLRTVILAVTFCTVLCEPHDQLLPHRHALSLGNVTMKPRFEIDYTRNVFLKNGESFRFISGEFHYFRALPETWQSKLRTMKAAGLNTVATYIEWSLHNPQDNVYRWDGIANLEKFIQLAAEEGLYVIFRPGPYICAERDNGGFPFWLYNKYPNIELRTYNRDYLTEVEKWYRVLMPKFVKYLFGNGGPIILVQVENEYGSYYACDRNYMLWLKNETLKYVGDDAVLFTNDGPSQVGCGKIEGVLAGLDFGPDKPQNVERYWKTLRKVQPRGPLVNAEFYPGWLTHWQEKMSRTDVNSMVESLDRLLQTDVNVNFYMFFGGTNFGFTAGANDGGPGRYNSDVTSYDYDAPMSETGEVTEKFHAIRKVISKYAPVSSLPSPNLENKIIIPTIPMHPIESLLSANGRKILGDEEIVHSHPLTFEALNQFSGLILYETDLPKTQRDPSLLKLENVRDRAYVYVDRNLIGILSRENLIDSLPINAGAGKTLQILVENEGRIGYGRMNDYKGIVGDVLLNNQTVRNWTMTGFPFEDASRMQTLIQKFLQDRMNEVFPDRQLKSYINNGPVVFFGEFLLSADTLYDTFLNPTGWGKGIVFVNGFNLGRYWPTAGPQITLYIPKELFKVGTNEIVMVEYQRESPNLSISFTNVPNLDGY